MKWRIFGIFGPEDWIYKAKVTKSLLQDPNPRTLESLESLESLEFLEFLEFWDSGARAGCGVPARDPISAAIYHDSLILASKTRDKIQLYAKTSNQSITFGSKTSKTHGKHTLLAECGRARWVGAQRWTPFLLLFTTLPRCGLQKHLVKHTFM